MDGLVAKEPSVRMAVLCLDGTLCSKQLEPDLTAVIESVSFPMEKIFL